MPRWMLAVALGACAGTTNAPLANHGARGPSGEVRAIDWQNRTYQLDDLGPVTVIAGHADFAIGDDDKAVELAANPGSYTVEHPLFADINGDGVDDAIITSALATGGTGQFSDLRVYTVRAGQVVELAGIAGGDRGDGGIRHVALDGTAIVVDRNVLSEGDGMCCPSMAQRERWTWRDDSLTEDVAARRPIAVE